MFDFSCIFFLFFYRDFICLYFIYFCRSLFSSFGDVKEGLDVGNSVKVSEDEVDIVFYVGFVRVDYL